MIILRILLIPFSLLYALVTGIRNWMFQSGILKSVSFEVPVINVGNLRVGGTGKTPHVEFLIREFSENYHVATLSRGYGRETRGFLLAENGMNSRDIGDEPLQIYRKFGSKAIVSVCEDRALAIPRLLSEKEEINLILLDDAFQHRYIKPRVNILLTGYDQPFFRDFILPTGMLRESHYGARRADIIVVSKCPEYLDEEMKSAYRKKISLFCKPATEIYFSYYRYGKATAFNASGSECPHTVFLVSGLANSRPFEEYVKGNFQVLEEKHFADHYDFYFDDVAYFSAWLDKHPGSALLCTEKDFVKLNDGRFKNELKGKNLFYIPVEVDFGEEKERFLSDLKKRIEWRE